MPIPDKRLSRSRVEFNLTEHCNLSCYGCDHASPLLNNRFAALEEFSRDFTALAEVFHAKQLRIVGGEPLLHPQLSQFLKEARRIGIADSIVVITNGVLLHQVPSEVWGLIDELWISVYPGVDRKLDDEDCARICKTHNVRLQVEHRPAFNKTLINNRIKDPVLVGAIFDECENTNCHTVYEGRFYKCSVSPFMRQRLALLGVDFDNHSIDGIALHDNANLYDDLDTYLGRRTPLAACSYCLGTSGPAVAHHQLNRRGRSMWLEEDNDADIEAVRRRLMDRRHRTKKWIRDRAKRIAVLQWLFRAFRHFKVPRS